MRGAFTYLCSLQVMSNHTHPSPSVIVQGVLLLVVSVCVLQKIGMVDIEKECNDCCPHIRM